jgi:hypothetical protein
LQETHQKKEKKRKEKEKEKEKELTVAFFQHLRGNKDLQVALHSKISYFILHNILRMKTNIHFRL